jgi:hypothetical protein
MRKRAQIKSCDSLMISSFEVAGRATSLLTLEGHSVLMVGRPNYHGGPRTTNSTGGVYTWESIRICECYGSPTSEENGTEPDTSTTTVATFPYIA